MIVFGKNRPILAPLSPLIGHNTLTLSEPPYSMHKGEKRPQHNETSVFIKSTIRSLPSLNTCPYLPQRLGLWQFQDEWARCWETWWYISFPCVQGATPINQVHVYALTPLPGQRQRGPCHFSQRLNDTFPSPKATGECWALLNSDLLKRKIDETTWWMCRHVRMLLMGCSAFTCKWW